MDAEFTHAPPAIDVADYPMNQKPQCKEQDQINITGQEKA